MVSMRPFQWATDSQDDMLYAVDYCLPLLTLFLPHCKMFSYKKNWDAVIHITILSTTSDIGSNNLCLHVVELSGTKRWLQIEITIILTVYCSPQ